MLHKTCRDNRKKQNANRYMGRPITYERFASCTDCSISGAISAKLELAKNLDKTLLETNGTLIQDPQGLRI